MIKCACCKKEIEDMFNRKYCGHCSRYTEQLRKRVSYFRLKFKIVNKKLYGTEDGAQRIRHTQSKPKTNKDVVKEDKSSQ